MKPPTCWSRWDGHSLFVSQLPPKEGNLILSATRGPRLERPVKKRREKSPSQSPFISSVCPTRAYLALEMDAIIISSYIHTAHGHRGWRGHQRHTERTERKAHLGCHCARWVSVRVAAAQPCPENNVPVLFCILIWIQAFRFVLLRFQRT